MAFTSLSATKCVLLKTVNSNSLYRLGLTYKQLSPQVVLVAKFFHKKSNICRLGQSTILMQDGCGFQELPVIVRKVTNKDNIELLGVCSGEQFSDQNRNSHEEFVDVVKQSETKEIIAGFNRCYSPKGIFALLDVIPSDEVTPQVALQALHKIIVLENNKEFRNTTVHFSDDIIEDETSKNFTRTAVLNQLVDTISCSEDSGVVLSGLKLVSRDLIGGNTEVYKEKLCNEVLCRATDGKFNINQICDAVKVFYDLNSNDIDKLWVGIIENGNNVNETNIMSLFKSLPYLKKSKKVIMNLLEKKLVLYWWKLSARDIAEILCIVKENGMSSRILNILSRWINTNIHSVNEEELLNIVNGFRALEYSSQGIYKALERYVKAKSINVKNQGLIGCICDFSCYFRIRSQHILQGASEYLVAHNKSISPITVKSIITSLGQLDYHPLNRSKFWQDFESLFEEMFIQYRPQDALDMLLSCIYLEKYPLNFVKKVFNPYFLDRLHSCKSSDTVQVMRTKLKILDFAMALECDLYRGPLLPKDNFIKSVWMDGRSRRILNFISANLTSLIGRMNTTTAMATLPQLPLCELYVIDLLVHPSSVGAAVNFLKDRDLCTAVLILLPEHYCHDGQKLIGPQVMRKRHFRKLGLKVVTLDYLILSRLKVHPPELNEYLRERFKNAELSL